MRSIYLISFLAISLIAIGFFSCEKEVKKLDYNHSMKILEDCVEEPVPADFDLTKQQGLNLFDVGDVSIWNDNDFIYVEVTADATFDNTKLFVGSCDNIPSPLTGAHNNVDHVPATNTYMYTLTNTYNPGDIICFSLGASGNRKSDGSYTILEICEDCEIALGDFRTQSKGGWGAPPNGGNSAAYMYNNWDAIDEFTIGCGQTTLTFTTAEEVTDFLPNGFGYPSPFNTNLATQIAALTISLALDEGVPDFGNSDDLLGCMVLETDDPELSAFNGMTVYEILDLANEVLGGCSTVYTMEEMTAIVDALNLNFHGGDTDHGLLTCGSCNNA